MAPYLSAALLFALSSAGDASGIGAPTLQAVSLEALDFLQCNSGVLVNVAYANEKYLNR